MSHLPQDKGSLDTTGAEAARDRRMEPLIAVRIRAALSANPECRPGLMALGRGGWPTPSAGGCPTTTGGNCSAWRGKAHSETMTDVHPLTGARGKSSPFVQTYP
ncbi:MAG: hypothetical protein DM484_05680 [Candidatus Methylumidiphilus alinenensis]|uniref:Uncharacterized protein n=1 Tax=Candidatus Methylumidiphilus alinenensis TaxID=2202197 RepID=A0A2W4T6B1_9GAMM|nr:MAG: hypothetical protein DM484_05680 [Candidatus Methylumidiphilus alinenensis]